MTESIKLTNFRRITDMPERVLTSCQTMGQRAHGHLLEIIRDHKRDIDDRDNIELRSAYVIEADGIVVGWACLYVYNGIGRPLCVSLWVKTRHRGKGYGKLLMDIAWKRWNHLHPRTYKMCAEYWSVKRHKQNSRFRK